MIDPEKYPRICDNCEFVHVGEQGMDLAQARPMECHLLPPTVLVVPSQAGIGFASFFPMTKPGNWCGQHQYQRSVAEAAARREERADREDE